MRLGEKICNLRKTNKLSQEKLAEKLGVSRQSVSKWETGTAYPEMNRIIELCKIFKCQLNDLINDNILDFESLDEEIKMNVVKFNEKKQKNLKVVSGGITICCRVLQVIMIGISLALFFAMFLVPSTLKEVSINEGEISIGSFNIQELNIEDEIIDTAVEVFNEYSNLELILWSEITILSLIICFLVMAFAMLFLSKLFNNISIGTTPFTLENLKYIKYSTILYVIYLVLPDAMGTLIQLITKINLGMEYEFSKVFYILIIICIYYIFDYGHQIQLDSKGKIYGMITENNKNI